MGKKGKRKSETPQETLMRLMNKINKVSNNSDDGDSSDKENVTKPNEKESLEKIVDETRDYEDEQQSKEENPDVFSEGENEWKCEHNEAAMLVGEDPSKSSALSVTIREDLLNIWKTFSLEGLKKDVQEALLEKYECSKDLKAPELNPQVAAKISSNAKKRDEHVTSIQFMTALSMTIVGALMTKVHESRKEGLDVIEILEPMSDVGKMLALIMHKQSSNRKAFIEPGMTKEGLEIIKQTKIEDFQFGNELTAKIKEIRAFATKVEGIVKVAQVTPPSNRTFISKTPLRGRPSSTGYTPYPSRQQLKFVSKGRQHSSSSNNRGPQFNRQHKTSYRNQQTSHK
ncbi:hypothetical protein TKK_0012966 [Trichogramma kaykai]